MVSEPLQKTFLREKSELKLREKEEVTIILHLLYVHILKLSNQYFFCAGEGRGKPKVDNSDQPRQGARRLHQGTHRGFQRTSLIYLIFRREGSREW